MKRPPTRACLRFMRTELLYDIANYAYVEGQPMESGAEYVQDIAADGNRDRVGRVLNMAYGECVERLYPFASRPALDGTAMDDMATEPTEYRISLRLPPHFAEETLRLLRNCIHEYMVCRAVADWMSITKPDAEQRWRAKAEEASDGMHAALTERTGRIRRTQTPF